MGLKMLLGEHMKKTQGMSSNESPSAFEEVLRNQQDALQEIKDDQRKLHTCLERLCVTQVPACSNMTTYNPRLDLFVSVLALVRACKGKLKDLHLSCACQLSTFHSANPFFPLSSRLASSRDLPVTAMHLSCTHAGHDPGKAVRR